MKASSELWNCPLCSLKLCAFGTLPCDSTCTNRKNAHITGLWYLQGVEQAEAESIGIAAISDEADVKVKLTSTSEKGN